MIFLFYLIVIALAFYIYTSENPQVRLRATPDLRDERYKMKMEALEDEYYKVMNEQGNYL